MVISHLLREYKCNSPILEEYLEEAKSLLEHFANVIISHVPKTSNEVANDLAQQAFGYKLIRPDISNVEEGLVASIHHQLIGDTS